MAGKQEDTPGSIAEPAETAMRNGLQYVDPDKPGITRRRRGTGFSYHDARGNLIREEGDRQRLLDLVIPPAWEDVWICPDPKGHLQAVGRDAAGRKQYLYHERFRQAREAAKFERLVSFGQALPRLRRRVGRDLALDGMPRDKVVAAGVRILDQAAIRVGGSQYERSNRTYGLTTLRRRHVAISRKKARLEFEGKGGREIEIELADPDLVRVLRECDELPGYRLFQYIDENGNKQAVGAEDVNAYLQEAGGGAFTAKDFRTWAATTTAIATLADRERDEDEDARRSIIVEVAEIVGGLLHNTATVSRQSYIHPRIEELFLEGTFHEALKRARKRESQFRTPGRRRDERLAMAMLTDAG
jgi:DNA topoisomerase-1